MIKAITVFTLIGCVVALVPATAQAQAVTNPTHNHLNIPIKGTGTAGTFNGTFRIVDFTFQNGQMVAHGIVTGTVTNSAGVVHSLIQTVSAPLANAGASAAAASCSILHLVLGPIDLNILGLKITTNQIVLDISAIPGTGNLLGNLLCDIANLLNTPSQTLAGLLNQLLSILQSI
jgi:hypothetical protein